MQAEQLENQIHSAAEKLLSAHDGDVALLYIYRLHTGSTDCDRAAHDLCRTLAEITAAAEKLERMGLGAPSAPAVMTAPEPQLPEYSSNEIVRRSKEDRSFSEIVAQAQSVFGRTLSGADMKMLFGIYDYLNLPQEVIFELLTFCVQSYRERYGDGRLPSMRYVEKEAYAWANREILTLEQADEYIRQHQQRREDSMRIAEALNIRGRELTATEKKYVGSWMDMGYGAEELAIAYDRTVTSTGTLKWGYMDKIVSSWNAKGLHGTDAIEQGDPRRSRTGVREVRQDEPGTYSMDDLKSIYDKV